MAPSQGIEPRSTDSESVVLPLNDKGMKELGCGALNEIMFIGRSPASINKTGLQETSNFNQYFLELLKPIGISQSEFYFTNLIKIPISNMKKVPKTVIHHCADHLIDEYLAVNPKIVIISNTNFI